MPGENAEVHPLAARCRPERRTGSRCDTHGRFRLRRLSFDHARRRGVLHWHLRVQPVVASPRRVQAEVGPAVARSPARRPDTRRPFGRLAVEAVVLRSATAADEPQSLMRKIRRDFALKQNCLPPNAVIKLSKRLLCRGRHAPCTCWAVPTRQVANGRIEVVDILTGSREPWSAQPGPNSETRDPLLTKRATWPRARARPAIDHQWPSARQRTVTPEGALENGRAKNGTERIGRAASD